MKRLLLLPVLLAAAGRILEAAVPAGPPTPLAEAMRQGFAQEEQWMLDTLLSQEGQRKEFEAEAARAAVGGEREKQDFTRKWRRRMIALVQQYRKELTKDIVPNAPGIEKMVSNFEAWVTYYRLKRQPLETQQAAQSKISWGNSILGVNRDYVENGVRENRRDSIASLNRYLASEEARLAMAEKPPPARKPAPSRPAPSPAAPSAQDAPQIARTSQEEPRAEEGGAPGLARDSGNPEAAEPGHRPEGADTLELARAIERQLREAERSPSEEAAAQGTDQGFSGGEAPPGEAPPPVAAGESEPGGLRQGLTFNPEEAGDGLRFDEPPPPLVQDGESGAGKGRFLGLGLGAAIGGAIGFVVGRGIGAVVGALLLAAVGYLIGMLASSSPPSDS